MCNFYCCDQYDDNDYILSDFSSHQSIFFFFCGPAGGLQTRGIVTLITLINHNYEFTAKKTYIYNYHPSVTLITLMEDRVYHWSNISDGLDMSL